MNIIIRNLDRKATEEELRIMMSKYGTISSCNLVMDEHTGLSKGFGFAEMPVEKEWKAAIKGLDGKVIGKSKIRVKTTKARPPKNMREE